ncbi:S9 family peptidase [Amycolatopsis roodepoortensis]|uniref:S9 family peptidase n=1 Tax=Amycolatopsis roodepoortensis TaxID=700274 RepID=UPI00214C705F|nr:S9 family peptidase [Amycolatopsis roodepoortensis]UUV32233.1 S9 family peptidase [Amycolatopsis roodepoortensis]
MTSTAQHPKLGAGSVIPRAELFGNPEHMTPSISPDGRWLAWVAPHEGVLNLWVRQADTDEDARPVTADRDRGIRDYMWAPDSEHLLYLRDQGGDENSHLYAVSVRSGDVRDLTPFDGVKAVLLAWDLQITDRVLVGLNQTNPQLHDVYDLYVATGELVKVLDNPGLLGLVADSQLDVRAGLRSNQDGGRTIMVREVDGEWRPLLTVDPIDALSTVPVGFDRHGRRLLVKTSADANATRLVWIDVESGEHEVVVEDPIYDVSSVLTDVSTRLPVMVSVQRERLHTQALVPEIKRDLDTLAEVDDGDLHVVSADRANATWVVSYAHADGPTASYVYDRATSRARFLFHDRPRLATRLKDVKPFSFTARDGLEIHGYLTFPAGNAEKLPTVLLVHGGPWSRDTWRLNTEAQWLADRGYLCIQVNFRGSTGYGTAFTAAGNREWGAKMHTDLLDGLTFAVEAGYADPDRIGIYGASYGGYAALAAAAFTPEVFRCAISLCGPSNLETLLRALPPHLTPLIPEIYRQVGNPDTEPDFLKRRSPLSYASHMTIPMLIAQGANDPRVPQSESDQIVAALRDNGVPPEYLLFHGEGHGLQIPENRLKFYATAERFLAEHLDGWYEPEPA